MEIAKHTVLVENHCIMAGGIQCPLAAGEGRNIFLRGKDVDKVYEAELETAFQSARVHLALAATGKVPATASFLIATALVPALVSIVAIVYR